MKHTNFQAKVNEVKHLEFKELKKALEAHGGSYEWNLKDYDSYPTIAINVNKSYPAPQDVRISKATIVNGDIKLSGVDMEDDSPVNFDTNDVFAGHLSYITDEIPATNEISDVSLSLPSKTYIPHIGDKVWLFNRDRRDKDKDRYGEVSKIGRKYFHVKTGLHTEERFKIDTLEHENGEYSPDYELYISQETCEFHQKAIDSRRAISNHLFQFLTDKEAIELRDMLVKREK